MIFRKKSGTVEGVQWTKPGDHLKVHDFRPPLEDLPSNPYCSECGNLLQRHGFLTDGAEGPERICPGDYIINNRDGFPYRYPRGLFESQYEIYARPPRFPDLPSTDIEERVSQRKPREAP